MKCALIQTNPGDRFTENVEKTFKKMEETVKNGADVVVLPETFSFMGPETGRKQLNNNLGSGIFKQMQDFCKIHKIFLVGGSVDERAHAVNKFYNTCITINQNGEIISTYRKQHLFNLRDNEGKPLYCESETYDAGTPSLPYKIDVNNESWNCKNIICYDIRFPEAIRHDNKHLDLIFVPAAFTHATGSAHWEVLLRARAIENQCYVVACNQTGYFLNGQKRNYGHSMVIDPWGNKIAHLQEEESILYAHIDKKEILNSRTKLPALNDRKII